MDPNIQLPPLLRALLAEAGEARREGDTGAAVSLECDALRAMRAGLAATRQEARQ